MSDIFDGCLSYLRESLTAVLPPGQEFINGGIKNLVGTKEVFNARNDPFENPPAYFEIYFAEKFIFPTAYSLMGRRSEKYKDSYLKSWEFSGKNRDGNWVLLHSETNKPFKFAEERTFPLTVSESFNGFKISMTEKNTNPDWALCLGQIEVFGDIFSSPNFRCGFITKQCNHKLQIFHFIASISLLS